MAMSPLWLARLDIERQQSEQIFKYGIWYVRVLCEEIAVGNLYRTEPPKSGIRLPLTYFLQRVSRQKRNLRSLNFSKHGYDKII